LTAEERIDPVVLRIIFFQGVYGTNRKGIHQGEMKIFLPQIDVSLSN